MGLWKRSGGVSRKSSLRSRPHIVRLAGSLAMAAAMIVAGPVSASARVHASILVDAQSGEILESHNADQQCYPASLVKLMTLYITFQQLSSGKMTLQQKLRVSSHAAAQPPTKLGLRSGQRISVKSAILAITTRSANDVAVVLAEGIAGTESKFARLMNQMADRLGLEHTTFYNASGLPNRRQRTTARDMAKLALAILHDYAPYYHFFQAKSFVFRGRTIRGHDHLLGRYGGVDGMKTGYTRASGYNIVTSAVRHDRRLLGVVIGGSSARTRDRQMMALLNRGFSRLRAKTLMADSQEEAGADDVVSKYLEASGETTEDDLTSRSRPGWIVQIGGNFRNPRQVRRALKSAVRTAPGRLEGTRPLVVRLSSGRYRARFSDMSETTARATCRVLREKKFTCRVLQVRSSRIALASAGR